MKMDHVLVLILFGIGLLAALMILDYSWRYAILSGSVRARDGKVECYTPSPTPGRDGKWGTCR